MKFLPLIVALPALFLLGNACTQTLTRSSGNACAQTLRLADGAPAIAPVPPADFFDSIFEKTPGEISEKTGKSVPANALVIPHKIRAEFAGTTREADGILKIARERLTLVVSAPPGRIFTLVQERDGAIVLERGPFAPPNANIDPAYLLSDIALVFAGVPALQKHFAAPWRFEEILEEAERAGTRTRRLFYKNRLICEIEFSAETQSANAENAGTAAAARERVKLQNFERGYLFEIIPTPDDA